MPTAIRVAASIPVSDTASRKSDNHQLVSIALFSGIGLLVSLLAVMSGVQGVWY